MNNYDKDHGDGKNQHRHKHKDGHKDGRRDGRRDDGNGKDGRNPPPPPPMVYLSNTELKKNMNGFDTKYCGHTNLIQRIRHNIFKKVTAHKTTPTPDSLRRIGDYLRENKKKSHLVLKQLKTNHGELKVKNKNLTRPGDIVWVFNNIIDFKFAVSLPDDTQRHNLLLAIAENVISQVLTPITNNSNTSMNMNMNMGLNNGDESAGIGPVSEYKICNTDVRLDFATHTTASIKALFNGEDGNFKSQLIYWEYLMCIVLFLKGEEKSHSEILNIFKPDGKNKLKKIFASHPFYKTISQFEPSKEQHKKTKGGGGGGGGGDHTKKHTDKKHDKKPDKPPELTSNTFNTIMESHFKMKDYIRDIDFANSLEVNKNVASNKITNSLYKSIYPHLTRYTTGDLSVGLNKTSRQISYTAYNRLTETYRDSLTIKAFRFLYDNNDVYNEQMVDKIQIEITKFLLGYYSLIQLTCNEAMNTLGIPIETTDNANPENKPNNAKNNAKGNAKGNGKGNANGNAKNNNSTITVAQKNEIISKAHEQFVKIRDNYKKLASGDASKKRAMKTKLTAIIKAVDALQVM